MERVKSIINKTKAMKALTLSEIHDNWFEEIKDLFNIGDRSKEEVLEIIEAYALDKNDTKEENMLCSLLSTENEYLTEDEYNINQKICVEGWLNTQWVKEYIKENKLDIDSYDRYSFIALLYSLIHYCKFSNQETGMLNANIDFRDESKEVLKELYNEIINE
jgi:hypothetical protein